MNEVYKSDTMGVHDDREFITPEEAYEILHMEGKSVLICDPPNFSAELEFDIYSHPFPVWIYDVIPLEDRYKMTDEAIKERVVEYLRGYEISK